MVVVFYCVRLAPYCHDCYAELHKRLWFQWYPRLPLNHSDARLRLATLVVGLYLGAMSWVFARFWNAVQAPRWLTVLVALGLPAAGVLFAWYLRWQSWIRFERPLQSKWFRDLMGRDH
ncbi:MAG: hypothetical protein NUV94_03385 [Candidatus Acetothermia bacterium]|jgi:hypothetical protein|nr:hypothetical protein [Candidatus Acetothermia bacterium]